MSMNFYNLLWGLEEAWINKLVGGAVGLTSGLISVTVIIELEATTVELARIIEVVLCPGTVAWQFAIVAAVTKIFKQMSNGCCIMKTQIVRFVRTIK